MSCRFIFVALLSLLPATCFAQIRGPSEVGYGELVKLTVVLPGQTQWQVTQPVDLQFEQEGNSVYFASGCKPSTIVVVSAMVDFEAQSFQFLRHIVTVGKGDPPPEPEEPEEPEKPSGVTKVVYVYEKDDGAPPLQIKAALRQINEGGTITASAWEDDTTTGSDTVPDQFKVARGAAQTAGTPCLVIQAGDKVVAILKDPQTLDEVMEAIDG